jgi:hypothetical protein
MDVLSNVCTPIVESLGDSSAQGAGDAAEALGFAYPEARHWPMSPVWSRKKLVGMTGFEPATP